MTDEEPLALEEHSQWLQDQEEIHRLVQAHQNELSSEESNLLQFELEAFWEGVKGIDYIPFNDEREKDLFKRLRTYPDMQKFWKKLFVWLARTKPRSITNFGLLPTRLARYAAGYVRDEPKLPAITESQRGEIVDRIRLHANALSKAMSELNLPRSVYWYLPPKKIIEHLHGQLLYVGYEADIEDLKCLDDEVAEQKDTATVSHMKGIVDCNMRLLGLYGSAWDKSSILSIYDVLETLTDRKPLLERLPKAEVERKTRTATKRALIKNFSTWLGTELDCDANKNKDFIAIFVETVLNHACTEETVKDALRGFNYLSKKDPGE